MSITLERQGPKWFNNWWYGMNSFPNNDHSHALLKAVFVIARGDGVISNAERAFFFGYLDAVGLPESLHDFVRNYEGTDRLEDLLAGAEYINDATKRAILYTAILVAGADGYAEGEREATRRAANILGVSEHVINELEAQFFAEEKLRASRIALLFPNGHPWA